VAAAPVEHTPVLLDDLLGKAGRIAGSALP